MTHKGQPTPQRRMEKGGGCVWGDGKYPAHPVIAATALTQNYTTAKSQISFIGVYSLEFVLLVVGGRVRRWEYTHQLLNQNT